ncbi:MAG TPA: KH domain-containing protein [Candidatus Dormibacteraeota bacterium]|nr:KH domain-containing protein [Candidatus Dormibacteraeota bacterium]
MIEIDQQFIEYVVKSLVGKPEAVHIDRRIDEKGVLLELTVNPEDLGRVIGKRGATAQSLRTLLRALGTKNDARYNLKIIDNGPLDHGHSSDDKPAPVKEQSYSDASDTSTDDSQVDDAASDDTDKPAEEEAPTQSEETEAVSEPEAVEEVPSTRHEDQTSDRLAQARQELADLDDLDL